MNDSYIVGRNSFNSSIYVPGVGFFGPCQYKGDPKVEIVFKAGAGFALKIDGEESPLKSNKRLFFLLFDKVPVSQWENVCRDKEILRRGAIRKFHYLNTTKQVEARRNYPRPHHYYLENELKRYYPEGFLK